MLCCAQNQSENGVVADCPEDKVRYGLSLHSAVSNPSPKNQRPHKHAFENGRGAEPGFVADADTSS